VADKVTEETEMLYEKIRAANKSLEIFRVTDPIFRKYGEVLSFNTEDIVSIAEKIPMPESGASYKPSLGELENCMFSKSERDTFFGEMPVQFGYCWGYNECMNAMEWHRSSEINIAVTPLVLILGRRGDIIEGRYNSSLANGFFLETGQAVEVYSSSLHFCPCQVTDTGFGCIVVLPEDTNFPIINKEKCPPLFAKNKWLLAHKDNETLIKKDVMGDIFGENHTIIRG